MANAQVALSHMDEKWFFGIVMWKHNKSIPFLGVMWVSHSVTHKSHINKTMAIASAAFVPNNNGMESRGQALKVSLERVGGHIKVPKTTHRRVHHDDGSRHCPKRDDNISKEKDEQHWTPMEITGLNEGTAKSPKFSPLKWFFEKGAPHLEEICQQVFTLTGKIIVARHQMDGVGPHGCAVSLNKLQELFDLRGWILKLQPSQPPLTDSKDACIFLAMSKEATAEQRPSHGSNVLEAEQLWKAVTKCWEEFPVEAIARAYAGHHQIVNAIAKCEGGD